MQPLGFLAVGGEASRPFSETPLWQNRKETVLDPGSWHQASKAFGISRVIGMPIVIHNLTRLYANEVILGRPFVISGWGWLPEELTTWLKGWT